MKRFFNEMRKEKLLLIDIIMVPGLLVYLSLDIFYLHKLPTSVIVGLSVVELVYVTLNSERIKSKD